MLARHRISLHPGEHAYTYPSSVEYTMDPSGRSAIEELTDAPPSRHARGLPWHVEADHPLIVTSEVHNFRLVHDGRGVEHVRAENLQIFALPGDSLKTE